jgi:serine/threonine protein kinase
MTLVMDYIKGGTLKQIIDRDGDKITLATLRLWFAELIIALEYIHSLNIIHRDVKPANCMIQIDGHLKLGDFGLSITDASVGVTDQAATVDCTDYTMVKLQKLFPLKPNVTVSRHVIFLADSDPNQTVEKILKKKFDVKLVKHNISVAQYFHHKKKPMSVGFSAILININLFNNVSPNLSQSQSTGDRKTQVGLNLIEEFSNHEKFKDIPIISLVSQTTELANLQDKCIKKGAREVITLPFTKNKELILDQTIAKYYEHDKFFTKFAEQGLLEKFAEDGSNFTMDQDNKNIMIQSENSPGNTVSPNSSLSSPLKNNNNVNFSISTVEDNPPSQSDVPLHSVGTPNFMAPEVINTRTKNKSSIVYTKSNDWWSCGVTFYECVMREKLFQGADKNEVFKSINQVLNLGNLEKESKLLFDLVSGLLVKDPLRRLDNIGIKMHPFFLGHEQIIYGNSSTLDATPIKIIYESIHWDVLPTNESVRPYKPTQLPLKLLSKEQKHIFRNKNIKKSSNLNPNKKKKHHVFVHAEQRKSWIRQTSSNVDNVQNSNSSMTTKSINYSSLNCVEEVNEEFMSNVS